MVTAPTTEHVDDGGTGHSTCNRRLLRYVRVAVLVLGTVFVAAYGIYRHTFPYGWTHSCDKQLYFALWHYSDDHGGQFPAGQPTPEACLSLLHNAPYRCNAHLLSGKNVEPEIAERLLASGTLLDPDTCGWHYVPGLSRKDDPRLALFWDKPGLGHNGQRLDGGGHIVWFVMGNRRHVRAAEWDFFLAQQQTLRQNTPVVE